MNEKPFFQEFVKKSRKFPGFGIYKKTKAVYNKEREVTEDVTFAL